MVGVFCGGALAAHILGCGFLTLNEEQQSVKVAFAHYKVHF
jgi:hypothetical protein